MNTIIKTYETLEGKFDAIISNEYPIFEGTREEYLTKGYKSVEKETDEIDEDIVKSTY